MNFQELRTAYLDIDYQDFTNKILDNLQEGLKNTASNEVQTLEEHKDYLHLLNSFRSSIAANDRRHGANFMKQITSMLSTGEDGVYINGLRYIFELIQNVDDCTFSDHTNCSLNIYFNEIDGYIVLSYNETGFTPFNVFAVTGIAEASKNISDGNAQIGEKGIGFKSVFGVAQRVWIQSGKFSFELDSQDFCVPIPVYDTRYKEVCGTRITLFMEPSKVQNAYKEICNKYHQSDAVFQNNPILFLNKLTNICFCNSANNSLTFSVTREKDIEGTEHSFEDNVQLGAVFSSRGESEDCSIRCVRYTLPIKFNRAQCISRYGNTTKLTGQTLKMQVIFPEVSELSKIKQGAFYSYLPTEIRMNVPIACHVPFKLDASREYVDSQHNNQWFTYCCSEFSRLMRSAYRHYAQKYTLKNKKYNDVIYFLPAINEPLFAQTNERVHCLNREEFLGKTFVQRDIFYSTVGNFLPASNLCYFQSAHPLTSPQKLCSFLNISLEAAVFPELTLQKDFGIKKIESVGEKLFRRAFELNAPAKEIFQYIDNHNLLDESSWNSLVQKSSNRSISVSQLYAIFNHPNCYQAFCRKCTDQKNHLFASGIQIRFDIPTVDVLSVDPLGELLEIDSFPSSLQKYFNRISNKCLLLQDGPTAFFLADNVIVLAGNTLDALSDLCNHAERQNLFGLQLKYREVSHALNSADDNLSSSEYLTLLRGIRSSQREALGTKQYNSYVTLLKDASMTPDRFLSELLQNADDCVYPDDVIPSFSLTFNKNTVITEYNECGFKKANVRAITAIGESTKKQLSNENSIGEKGVGFKSVFSVASKVAIHSGSFHFSLTKEKPTVPQILNSPEDQAVTGTKMILSMNQPFSSELQAPSNILQLCLCLRKLKEIKIGNIQIRINDTPTRRTIYLNGAEYIYQVIRYPFHVTDRTILAERENHQRTICAEQEIAFYLPSKDIKHGCVYSGLPTTVELNVPLYIDAPFELTTSREQIIKNRWNDMIWKQFRKGYLYLLESVASSMKIRVLQYLSFDHKLLGRTESYNFNLFSSDEYNSRFSDIASDLRDARIIPTFDKSKPIASIRDGAVLYPSLAQSLIPQNQVFIRRPLFQIVNTNSFEKYNGALKAIGCPDAPVEEVIRFLAAYASSNIDDDFAIPFWNYIYEQKNSLTDSLRNLLKKYALIPVLGYTLGSTEYIQYTSNIYTERAATTSPSEYYVLKTRILSDNAFRAIFDVPINEMNEAYRKTLYQENLRQHLRNDADPQLYSYLIHEYKKGGDMQKWGKETITSDMSRAKIPLKNELGEIRIGQIYYCDKGEDYFIGSIIPSCRCAPECNLFAAFAGFKELCDVYFEDLKITKPLTAEDIESFQDDYFKHGAMILESCIENQLIPEDLIHDCHLDGLQKQEYVIEPDEFPNEPIHNLKRLQATINNAPLQRIVKEERTRTVDCIQQEDGTTELFDKSYARNQILRRYTSLGEPSHCICQMCLKGKTDDLIEVNNIQSAPKYYWPEMRLSLCLECSKRFESLRSNHNWSAQFEQAILSANTSTPDPVKVPIGTVTITFTQTHLEQIKTILKKKLY